MIGQLQTGNPSILGFKLSGKLHDEDYRTFVPAVDKAIAAAGGKVRLFVQLDNFHGWDLRAARDALSLSSTITQMQNASRW